MIVTQIGYLNVNKVVELIDDGKLFSIYRTQRGIDILVMNTRQDELHLYYPDRSRLPYKDVEGRKIAKGERVFTSDEDKSLDTTHWNNGNQIMAYRGFDMFKD